MRTIILALFAAGCAGSFPDKKPELRPATTEAGVRHEEAFFEGAGGLRLFSQSWQPEGAPRAMLIIVHGLKDHGSRYAAAAAQLAQKGIAVHAADLRGHAKSDGRRVYIDSFDEYLEDLKIFVQRVRKPGVPLFLMGHSMGAAISTLFVLANKPELHGLLLSAGALKVDVGGFTIGMTKMMAFIGPRLALFSLDADAFSRDASVRKADAADPLIDPGKAPVRTAVELLKAIDRLREKSGELEVPLLAMHGSADKITPPEGSKELIERARGKDKTLKTYEGLFHDLLHEPEKAQVLADITGWIEQRIASK